MLSTRIIAGATAFTIAMGAAGAAIAPAAAQNRPGGYHGERPHQAETKPNKPSKTKKPKGEKRPNQGGHKPNQPGHGPQHAGGGGWYGWGPEPGWHGHGYRPPRPPRPPKAPWKVRPGPRHQVCTPRFETVRRWNPYRGWVVRQVYVGQSCHWQPVPKHRRHRW